MIYSFKSPINGLILGKVKAEEAALEESLNQTTRWRALSPDSPNWKSYLSKLEYYLECSFVLIEHKDI